MNKTLAISIGLLLLLFLVLFSTTYSVSFHEVAIRQRFGQSDKDSVITKPGLKLKLPIFADQVAYLDRRLQLLETPLETIPTADGQQMVVRAYLLWRVDVDDEGHGPLEFHTRYRTIDNAATVLGDRFKTALSAGLGRYRFSDLIGPGSRIREAEHAVMQALRDLEDSGVKPVSVGISQVLLPQRTAQAVLARMEATRETLAAAERHKGNAEAERIQSESRTMADKILAFATQRAEEIRAQGHEEAARYMAQMAEDPELATLLVWLDTLRATLSQRTTLILEADLAPWHMMRLSSGVDERGIPQPSKTLAASLAAEEQLKAAERALAEASGRSLAAGGESDADQAPATDDLQDERH
jgi:modulator of FtsH protease HflC